MEDLYKYERELYNKGLEYIGGVDEVGRGPLIGSVVSACVVLPKDFVLEGLTDSKKLSEKKRDEYYKVIKEKAIAIGIGIVDEKVIDKINIYEATKIAMKEAIKNTNIKPNDKRRIINYVKKYYNVALIIDNSNVYDHIINNKASKGRYTEYCIRRLIKKKNQK